MFGLSPSKLHELDPAAQQLDNSTYAVFKDVVGFGRTDLPTASPPDSTCRLCESVTEAHGSAKMRSDGDRTTAESRCDVRQWSQECQPRFVLFCCLLVFPNFVAW